MDSIYRLAMLPKGALENNLANVLEKGRAQSILTHRSSRTALRCDSSSGVESNDSPSLDESDTSVK